MNPQNRENFIFETFSFYNSTNFMFFQCMLKLNLLKRPVLKVFRKGDADGDGGGCKTREDKCPRLIKVWQWMPELWK